MNGGGFQYATFDCNSHSWARPHYHHKPYPHVWRNVLAKMVSPMDSNHDCLLARNVIAHFFPCSFVPNIPSTIQLVGVAGFFLLGVGTLVAASTCRPHPYSRAGKGSSVLLAEKTRLIDPLRSKEPPSRKKTAAQQHDWVVEEHLMGLTNKKEDMLREMPGIRCIVSKSKDGKFVIHRTVITHIKPPVRYSRMYSVPANVWTACLISGVSSSMILATGPGTAGVSPLRWMRSCGGAEKVLR